MRNPRVLPSFLAILAVSALFLTNAAWRIGGATPEQLFQYWRSSDDFAIAAGYAVRGRFPVAPYRVRDQVRRWRDPRFVAFRKRLAEEMAERQIQPLSFWRTLPPLSLSPDGQWRAAERFDDGGRALLLGLCYRALGGAAPFLLFWLGILAGIPVLAAIFLEFRAAAHGRAGSMFVILLSCSAFVLDMLALGYSAVGFHVLALLTLVAISIYSTLGAVTIGGLVARSAILGCLLAVFSIARGTVPSLLPAFVLALGIGVVRAIRPERAGGRAMHVRRLSLLGLTLALLCVPYPLLNVVVDRMVESVMAQRGRPMMPRYHDPALLIWKGLGDFDRTKGYEFTDNAGVRAIIRESTTGDAGRNQEIHLRKVILGDIREDPLWFASILGKRALSTITLYKIWPFGPRDGTSIIPATTPNEGVIDGYYSIAVHADWLTLGPWTREVPVLFILLPSLVLLLVVILPGARKSLAPVAFIAQRAMPALVILSIGVLAIPVLITTATAFEPECFVLVHFLALSFLIEGGAALAKKGGASMRGPLS